MDATEAPAMPTSPEPGDKVRPVLEAATTVFLRDGFSAATTDRIQRAARVSKATLYACFPTKEAMFAAVIERQCATMAEAMRAIPSAPGDIRRTLTVTGQAYLGFVLSPDGLALYRVATAEAMRFPTLARHFYLAGPRVIIAGIGERLAAASQAGEIDIGSIGTEAAASLFISLLRGEGQMECLTHPDARPSAAQIDHWVALAVETFLRAFGTDRF